MRKAPRFGSEEEIAGFWLPNPYPYSGLTQFGKVEGVGVFDENLTENLTVDRSP